MTQSNLKSLLEPVAKSYRDFHLFRGLTICWAGASAATILLLALYELTGWWTSLAIPSLIGGTIIATIFTWQRTRQTDSAYKWITRQIEAEHPRLKSLLLAAVEQEPDSSTGELNYLQERVVKEALNQNRKQPWTQKYIERVFFAQCCQWFALVLFAGFLITALNVSPSNRTMLGSVDGITITPGDTSVERGSGLVILARFGKWLPTEAVLIVNSAEDNNRRIPLVKNLDDPVFGGTIPEVKSDLVYEIEYGDVRSKRFKVTVFDHPEVIQADAKLTYPEYTKLSVKIIEDTRFISAVEGTELDYTLRLNKPVVSVRLLSRDDSVPPIILENTVTNIVSLNFPLTESVTYAIELVDQDGRTNKMPADLVIDVLENRVPDLKLTFPRRDLRVSPIEEVSVLGEVSDDFGLQAYGLAYSLGGTEPTYVELGEAGGPLEKKMMKEVVKLEELFAEPSHLLSYFAWADDLGPDGETRRTTSDLYFAEVRHFEEIFREGQPSDRQQQQSGGQGGRQSPSQKLAELQKQIISATWNIRRQENRAKPSSSYQEDTEVVRESQEQALEQANELQSRNERPAFKPLIESVITEMDKALEQLTLATEESSMKPLTPALSAEQASYQALLKLQAREFEVSRNQNGGGGGGGGGRSQQQLDQLELKQSENRYETERQATLQQQNPQQREQLQVLNRLRELARRQGDLNQRLQELQTALQEAETEEERESVRRQLKRLRDEERELLADVDSLQQRMNRPENQSQMSEARQQLEQTRSDVRRAVEKLENEAVSQALAAGTRAQRSLQQLREDFRKQTSSQFADEMRQLRSEAQDIAEKQEDIAQEIEKLAQPERKTLSDTEQRNTLADRLTEQKTGLTNILTNMRRITEQSEHAEPLLSKQLYDTIRKTDQAKANSAVEMSGELLRRGFVTQAAEPERQARKIIDELRQSIESAAESVLGGELEALRLARSELDDLTRQLEREIAEAMQNRQGTASPGTSTNALGGQLAQSQSGGNRNQQSEENSESRSGQPQNGDQSNQNQTAQNSQSGQGASGQGQAGRSQQPSPGQRGNPGGSGQRGPAWSQSGGTGGGGSDLIERFRGPDGPLTGRNFTDWSDRLRDVEEMVNTPELRNRIAEVRERARSVRVDLKRHSKEPQWDLVQSEIAVPLVEIRKRISEELARRESSDFLVPIDRDPVPVQYSELVRRYYEELGSTEQR